MLNDVVASDFSKYENNETMCAGNNQIVMESVNFLYRPYPPTEDRTILRNLFLNFLNDRKYYAPSILMAAQMTKYADTYVYRFDLKPRTMIDIPEDFGVPHGFEQIFLWGLPYWTGQNDLQWDNADKRVSDIIMTLWANFCKFTNPTQVGVYIKWDKFTHENPSILIIDKSFNMSDLRSLNYHAVQFWNDFYPNVLSFAAGCCNMSDSANPFHTKSLYNSSALTLCLIGQMFIIFHYSMKTLS
jgi:carboxylesterase type B